VRGRCVSFSAGRRISKKRVQKISQHGGWGIRGVESNSPEIAGETKLGKTQKKGACSQVGLRIPLVERGTYPRRARIEGKNST